MCVPLNCVSAFCTINCESVAYNYEIEEDDEEVNSDIDWEIIPPQRKIKKQEGEQNYLKHWENYTII